MRQANFIAAIVASLVSVGLTSAGEVDSNREHAISQLRAAGVKVERDETKPQQPVTRIFCGCHRARGSLVRELKHVPDVQVMNLRLHDEVTHEDLKSLRALTHMTELTIHNCTISDSSLSHLGNLHNIRKLQLSVKSISDVGLKHIAGLKKLEYLRLTGKGITDEGVVQLENLTGLKQLRLVGTSITDIRIAKLRDSLPDTEIRRL